MNKVLFFMLSLLSIQAFSVEEQQVKNQIGENLKVDIKFTLPKETIKYVVFASDDGGNTMKDTLELPDFIMSQDPAKAGFIAPPPKVYTKRIVGGKIENLSSTEKVTYVLNHTDGFVPNAEIDTIETGNTSHTQITSYLPKTTLENIVQRSGIKGYSMSRLGGIVQEGTSPIKAYFPAAQINMHNNNGVLEITSPLNDNNSSIPPEDRAKIEAYIGSGKPLGTITLKVMVK